MALVYYPQFDVALVTAEGVRIPLVSEDIIFYNITQAMAIDTIATIAEGVLEAGSFDTGIDPVALGDVVELRHATFTGTARFILQATAQESVDAVENHVAALILENAYTTKTPDVVAVFATDLDEPNAAPILLGHAKLGVTTPLPFQTNIAKNLRLYAAPLHKDDQFSAAALEQLDQLDLSVPSTGGGSGGVESLFDHYTDETTAGTSEETLYEGLVEAGQLGMNGDKIEAFYSGDLGSNANSKTITAYFAGTPIGGIGTVQNGKPWLFDLELIRVSNSIVRAAIDMMASGDSPLASSAEISGLDLANNEYTMELRATTPSAAGDVTAKMGNAVFFPAATPLATNYLLSEAGEYLFSEGGSALAA